MKKKTIKILIYIIIAVLFILFLTSTYLFFTKKDYKNEYDISQRNLGICEENSSYWCRQAQGLSGVIAERNQTIQQLNNSLNTLNDSYNKLLNNSTRLENPPEIKFLNLHYTSIQANNIVVSFIVLNAIVLGFLLIIGVSLFDVKIKVETRSWWLKVLFGISAILNIIVTIISIATGLGLIK